MCQGAIEEARIKKVYYILNKTKEINNTTLYEQTCAINKDEFLEQIQTFFKDKR
jgi:tRNA(Arg) A34 adenosine deaminase TadA